MLVDPGVYSTASRTAGVFTSAGQRRIPVSLSMVRDQADVSTHRFGVLGRRTSRWGNVDGSSDWMIAEAAHPADATPCVHRRVAWLAGVALVIDDEVRGAGEHEIRIVVATTRRREMRAGAASISLWRTDCGCACGRSTGPRHCDPSSARRRSTGARMDQSALRDARVWDGAVHRHSRTVASPASANRGPGDARRAASAEPRFRDAGSRAADLRRRVAAYFSPKAVRRWARSAARFVRDGGEPRPHRHRLAGGRSDRGARRRRIAFNLLTLVWRAVVARSSFSGSDVARWLREPVGGWS